MIRSFKIILAGSVFAAAFAFSGNTYGGASDELMRSDTLVPDSTSMHPLDSTAYMNVDSTQIVAEDTSQIMQKEALPAITE